VQSPPLALLATLSPLLSTVLHQHEPPKENELNG
jgi:hypothetical protein